jgi:hypothetical protein
MIEWFMTYWYLIFGIAGVCCICRGPHATQRILRGVAAQVLLCLVFYPQSRKPRAASSEAEASVDSLDRARAMLSFLPSRARLNAMEATPNKALHPTAEQRFCSAPGRALRAGRG